MTTSRRRPVPRRARAARRAAGACGLALALGACARVEVDAVYATRVAARPTPAAWELAVPRLVKAGGGSVHGKAPVLAGLDIDTDAVHGASASCHHGPPVTHPTPVEIRSYYTDRDIFVDVRWADPTPDRTPRSWRRVGEGWAASEEDEDGVAIIWGERAGRFGCQEACHQSDFTLRSGSLVDVRAMFLAEDGVAEEAWVWKPSLGGRDLIIDRGGFRTPAGAPYATLNSRAAHDPGLGPEARRAATFGAGDAPLTDERGRPAGAAAGAPLARPWAPAGEASVLSAEAWHRGGRWRVVFSRPRAAGPGRQAFRDGQSPRFGIAVFDGTSVNHHVVRDTQTLRIVAPRDIGAGNGEED